MAKIAQEIEKNFDYSVRLEELQTKDGKGSGFYGTVREDTGEVFGTFGKGYGLVQNRDAFSLVEEAFSESGLTYSERDIFTCRGGASCQMRYDFKKEILKVPKLHEPLALRLNVVNSFDGSSPLKMQIGFLRLVCANGMIGVSREFQLSKKHTGKLDLGFIKFNIQEALKKAHEELNHFAKMSEVELTQAQGENVIRNMVKKKIVSEKVAESILANWKSPKHKEDSARNLYNVLNSVTQIATHEISPIRFELGERITTNATRLLVGASRNNATLNELIALNA